MGKVSVTYKAPKDDNKVVETHGLTFYHDQAVELDEDEHEAFLAKAKGNRHFLVGNQTAEDPFGDTKGGAKRNFKGAIENARDHDFEQDQRDSAQDGDKYDGMLIDDLRAEADKRGVKHAGLSKPELRDALRKQDAK